MTKVQVVPLFAVPLGVSYVELGDWNPNWVWDKGGKFYSGHRQHVGLEVHEEFQKLKTQLESAAREYCKFLGDECPTLAITQMWANCYDRGARIHQHPHPNSLISGILYLDSHSSTTFVNPVIPQLKLNYEQENSNPHSSEHFTATSERGRVLLFPSWLNHLGEPSEAEQRITISFNTFPKELGNANRLDHWKAD